RSGSGGVQGRQVLAHVRSHQLRPRRDGRCAGMAGQRAAAGLMREETMANEQTRRAMLTGMAAGIGVIGMVEQVSAQAQASGRTFVLVHGAWHGGWCWRRVADLLQKQGHKVFTPTMTGLGERSHLIDAKVNLATHITDIVNVIKWEGLRDVVLVGHSYGGCIISGVAEEMGDAI